MAKDNTNCEILKLKISMQSKINACEDNLHD